MKFCFSLTPSRMKTEVKVPARSNGPGHYFALCSVAASSNLILWVFRRCHRADPRNSMSRSPHQLWRNGSLDFIGKSGTTLRQLFKTELDKSLPEELFDVRIASSISSSPDHVNCRPYLPAGFPGGFRRSLTECFEQLGPRSRIRLV